MLDNGFSISKVEVVNWGNFHGYQKFNLRSEDGMSGLFSEPSTSAILGVNGSGKSTLIDGIMMTLLPFENSLKLGVTNDVESGSSGGRGVKDYVLGKFASTGSATGEIRDSAYSRETGCSFFLLSFQHNSNPQKVLNLGRAWWYKSGKIHSTSLYFISHTPLNLTELTLQGGMPVSPKAFKESIAGKKLGIEPFETAESYFTAMSVCLGGVRKDDLKLFNRAFYVKSISNIDQFIRENMLLESESPHLGVLLENVRNGNNINSAIEVCQKKIANSDLILKQLALLKDNAQKQIELSREKQMLHLYVDWSELESYESNKAKAETEKESSVRELPAINLNYEAVKAQLGLKQGQLHGSDIHTRIELIQNQIEQLKKQYDVYEKQQIQVTAELGILQIKAPKKLQDIANVLEIINQKKMEIVQRQEELLQKHGQIQNKVLVLGERTKKILSELQHLQDHKTLIPAPIYQIKQQAIRDLGIPANHLLFVGEVIQVKKINQDARRACEAALDPISKNLLCHPDSLEKFTKWLNKYNNQKNVTVKRIQHDELAGSVGKMRYDSKSILNMLDIVEGPKNPFYYYLNSWLEHSFDYRIATEQEFNQIIDRKLVTMEGLVRSDRRTMKKVQVNRPFVLGWDTQEQIDELIGDLGAVQKEEELAKKEDKERVAASIKCENENRSLVRLEPYIHFEYLNLKEVEDQVTARKKDLETLKKENKSYELLTVEVEELDKKLNLHLTEKNAVEGRLKKAIEDIELYSRLIPNKKKDFEEQGICKNIIEKNGNLNEVYSYLKGVSTKIRGGKAYAQQTTSLENKSLDLSREAQSITEKATRALRAYEQDFPDANLSYRVPNSEEVARFYHEWETHRNFLLSTELVQAQEKFTNFFNKVLVDSVKTTVNEFKSQASEILRNIDSINQVLKLTNYEDLPTEKRYLQIVSKPSEDERIRRFKKQLIEVEGVLAPVIRSQIESSSSQVMSVLMSFVEDLQRDSTDRFFVTDVRNHFYFNVHSLRREEGIPDTVVEWFTGSKKDAKSSAQTTQLAYALLASALSYRFKFNDPVAGRNSLRTIILDEFGGKFDNEKPKDVVLLLEKMGFQSILVSPMSKADLLADRMSHLVLVHKISASHSKVQSKCITSKSEYERVLQEMAGTVK
jgi:uncharacterized protein YPO0396